MATYVFVRLFYEGKTEPVGDDIPVSPIPRNVATLKTKAVPECPRPNLVFVYGRGENYPAEGEARLPVRSSLPIADSDDAEGKLAPLRVVVPAPAEQPPTNADQIAELQPADSLSQLRGPIVLVEYSGNSGVDTNKKDPQLKNTTRKEFGSSDPSEPAEEELLERMKRLLLPKAPKLKFLDNERRVETFIDWKLFDKCIETSKLWVDDNNDAKRVFDTSKNEQLQMHLGGSNLVLYPLLFAADASNKLNENQHKDDGPDTTKKHSMANSAGEGGDELANKINFDEPKKSQVLDAQLFADAEWDNQEVLTHTEFGERLKLKLKADAWLRLELSTTGGSFKTPIFHFEHKTSPQGKALRKAILLSQLTWRRIFLACTKGYTSDYREALKAANEKCKDLLIWFTCLEGTSFFLGALKGHYEYRRKDAWQEDSKTRKIVSYAKFEFVSTRSINVLWNGKDAISLMYALARNLPYQSQTVRKLLPDITDAEMEEGQDYSKALLGSKRRLKQSKSWNATDSGSKENKKSKSSGGSPSNKNSASGYGKKECVTQLLNNEVTNVRHMWAIPNDAFFEKSTPFDGDHIFSGTWNGDKNVVARGTNVVVKAFSGDEELDNYDNEVGILDAIALVPHVQKLVLARKADHLDFAIIVSPMQPTTSSHIRSLEDIQELGRQVLRALVELRNLGVIHRDIKPSNILWLPAERCATLIDFGLATKAVMERASPKGVDNFPYLLSSSGNVGTEGYQAPEVLANCTYDEKIDVYSLGKTLQNIAAAARIKNNSSLDDVVAAMTKEDPSERCTAPEALGMTFFG